MASSTPATGTTSPAPAGAAIARLHPFDGLFLRAEHLNRMQDYTRELTRALGQSGGPGVVHGYHVGLRDGALEVSPGLAIDPAGRPLLMTTSQRRRLDDLTETDLWVIELVGEDVPFGDEEVYGALCDDPCAGGTSTRPYIGERVAVHLRPDSLAIDGGVALERRSRVASAWFERERIEAAALLPTSERDAPKVADFDLASWDKPTELAGGDAVPIGVLLRTSVGWNIDAWIARRDRIETPPRRAWQQRLGMRPLDVFLAQVLQFQVHLASRWPQASAALVGLAQAQLAVFKLDEAAEQLRHRRTKAALEHVTAASSALQGVLAGGTSLVGYGFLELPPAGYLPRSGRWPLEVELRGMFGAHVTLRFCTCRADYVAHAVEQAQHLDRIPLTARGPSQPQVDILVPDGMRSSDGTLTTEHNWVAFHRCRERDCTGPVQRESVDVYRYRTDNPERYDNVLQNHMRDIEPEATATATFAADPTAFPAPDVQPSIADWVTDASRVTLLALAQTQERRTLAGLRAASLGSILSSPVPVGGPITAVAQTEAIYVVVLVPTVLPEGPIS
ncbi:MAG: hypothetical protein ACRDRA_00575 [Pseudonocardiaceae bacterium]